MKIEIIGSLTGNCPVCSKSKDLVVFNYNSKKKKGSAACPRCFETIKAKEY